MSILGVSLSTQLGVCVAAAPLILMMLTVRWLDRRADRPDYASLADADKAWLLLSSVNPRMSLDVMRAFGSQAAQNFLNLASSLPSGAVKLRPKVMEEFCSGVMSLADHARLSGDPSAFSEFMEINYEGKADLLAADILAVWPQCGGAVPAGAAQAEPEAAPGDASAAGSSAPACSEPVASAGDAPSAGEAESASASEAVSAEDSPAPSVSGSSASSDKAE